MSKRSERLGARVLSRHAGMLLLIELMVAAPALASEEGGGGGDVAATPIGWAFRIINFGILVFLGYRMLRGAPQWFRARADKIVGAIAESRQIKEEADRLLQDSQRRLGGLEQEVAALRAGARQDAASETERIRATAREEQVKIEQGADAEITAAERATRKELKALVAQWAVQRAEALLKDQVTPERQAAFVRSFAQNLGSVN